MDSRSPAELLVEAAGVPFERAGGLPAEIYTSEAFLERELACVFSREWVCVGRASALGEVGAYLTYELAGQPALVVRGRDGVVRAMANVCRHRMSTLLEGTGRVGAIVCPYHGWTYELDGALRGAPLMGRSEGFRREEIRLAPVRCEVWLGWIYITLDAAVAPVAERLGALAGMLEGYRMEDYVECFRERFVWDTNWKVLAENFMESYHLPACHAATVGPHSRLEEMVCPPGEAAFNYHWITKEASLALGNAHPGNTRLKGDWRRTTALLAIYPSHLVTLTPGYFWYLSLHPKGTGQVEALFGGGLAPDFMADAEAGVHQATLKALLDAVNVEDKRCTERVYRGVSARAAVPGPLSYLERPIYDFGQYLAERIGGVERAFARS